MLSKAFVAAALVALTIVGRAGTDDGDRVTARDIFIYKLPDNDKSSAIPPVPPEQSPAALGDSGAKPNSAAVISGRLGLRYVLLLVDKSSNRTQAVDSDGVYKSGDCLALELESNRSAYLYVFSPSSEGTWDVLLPNPQMPDEREAVQARVPQRVPQNYCFELDDHVGEEHVFVVLSRNPEEAHTLHAAIVQGRTTAAAIKRDHNSGHPIQADAQVQDAIHRLRGRGFKLSKAGNSEDAADPYSVYVAPASLEKSDTIFVEIVIKHR
jgi:hypothetical protein